jgi:hypothetical protein
MTTHIMVDIETLGTEPGAVILSVACVRFSDEAHFSFNLNVAEQMGLGAHTDTRTLYDLAGVNVKDFAVPPPHVALNDAIGQVRAANKALAILARAHQTQPIGAAA